MNFIPAYGYLHVEDLKEIKEELKEPPFAQTFEFEWKKQSGDLAAVRIVAGNHDDPSCAKGQLVVVISSMIQEFEFAKTKFKICPVTAIVGFINE